MDWRRKNAVATAALQSLPSASADEGTKIELPQLSAEDMEAVEAGGGVGKETLDSSALGRSIAQNCQ